MATPVVSVVIPARDCFPYLARCLDSVLAQTIGPESLDVIAVDDASTDGSAELLDCYATGHSALRVIHREGSLGRAGPPRNDGLAAARGRYVFCCDADDWLGAEALERMLAMAISSGSDIVLGKTVGVSRSAPQPMYWRNQERADLFASGVYDSLSVHKLYRRDVLARHRLRFAEDLLIGEDALFAAHAYLHAETISVVADYDCYYFAARPDGTAQQQTHPDPLLQLTVAERLLDQVARHVPPGSSRDHLMVRHFRYDVLPVIEAPWNSYVDSQRVAVLEGARTVCKQWLEEAVLARLPAPGRLRLHCAQHGLLGELTEINRAETTGVARTAVVSGGRVYAAYPYFGDPRSAIPADHYDITEELRVKRRLTSLAWDGDALVLSGQARIEQLDSAAATVEVVLRERFSGRKCRLSTWPEPMPDPGGDYGPIGFAARIPLSTVADGSALPRGLWDVSVAVRVNGVERDGRLGSDRDEAATQPAPLLLPTSGEEQLVVVPYYTVPYGNLTIDVGGQAFPLERAARLTRVTWGAGTRLRVSGELTFGRGAAPVSAIWALALRHRRSRHQVCVPVAAVQERKALRFWALVDVTALARKPGLWEAYLQLDLGGRTTEAAMGSQRAPGECTRPQPLKVRQGIRRRSVRVCYPEPNRTLSLAIRPIWYDSLARLAPARGLARILRRNRSP